MRRTVPIFAFFLMTAFLACADRPAAAQKSTGRADGPSSTISGVTTELVLAQADAGPRQVEKGDTVIVIADGAKLMMGRDVVTTLKAGTELPVDRVDGPWIGTQITVAGQKRSGWIKLDDVKLRAPAPPATTEAADDSPASPEDETTADAPQEDEAPPEPKVLFDVDLMVILSDDEMADIDRADRINKLKLTGPGVSNAALKDLDELALVNLLSIESTQITNAGLGLLSDATNVRSLRLWQREFDDDALRQLKKLPALEFLDLEGTKAGGEELDELKDLVHLKTLVLGPATEDAQLEALGNLPALEELDLRCCRNLTDAGVVHLEDLTELKALWLPRQVTDEGELRLTKKLPGCKIER